MVNQRTNIIYDIYYYYYYIQYTAESTLIPCWIKSACNNRGKKERRKSLDNNKIEW